MRTFVQFLKRNENGAVELLAGKEPIKVIYERKPLNAQMIEGLALCDKHEQTNEIIGFNIVEINSFLGNPTEKITHQNIFDF